jgi:hypothetical protein
MAHCGLLGTLRDWPPVVEMLVVPAQAPIKVTGDGIVRLPIGNNNPPDWYDGYTGLPVTFVATFYDLEAHLPLPAFRYLLLTGKVRALSKAQPPPSFARVQAHASIASTSTTGPSAPTTGQSGLAHGVELDSFARWWRVATPEDISRLQKAAAIAALTEGPA